MTEPPPGPWDPPNWPPPEPPPERPRGSHRPLPGSHRPPSRSPGPARGSRIVGGIAIAILVNVLMRDAVYFLVAVLTRGAGVSSSVIAVALLVPAGCVAAGVVVLRRHDRGIGLGLIIGGALGALCGPAGMGLCASVL